MRAMNIWLMVRFRDEIERVLNVVLFRKQEPTYILRGMKGLCTEFKHTNIIFDDGERITSSCEGRCLRSFHPTKEDGKDSLCESLCLSEAERTGNFDCANDTNILLVEIWVLLINLLFLRYLVKSDRERKREGIGSLASFSCMCELLLYLHHILYYCITQC